MSGPRVLVVDDDPWILRMVTATLEKRQYRVETARDGQQALERVQASPPDVIITDVMMPVMDGWTFVQKLRSTPNLSAIPVIFLTALGKDERRLRELGLGPGDYLSKPFRFDELERRVSSAMAKTSSAEAEPAPAPEPPAPPVEATRPQQGGLPVPPTSGNFPSIGLSYPPAPGSLPPQPQPSPAATAISGQRQRTTALNGKLEQLGLSSLLVMMEMERKDGVLSLKDGDSEQVGRIFIRKGQVISARVDDDPSQDGRDSVYTMLAWKRGMFSFAAMEVDMEDTVKSSTTHLLMEGARLIDEGKR